MADRIKRDLVMKAFHQAVLRRGPSAGLIAHSDRGSQYASHDYQALLKKHGAICSMATSCYENATMESFFHTLKTELIHFEKFETRKEATQTIFEYIEVFYNNQRSHSSLGYRSPRDFETAYRS
jgi:transposase InsO family protein